MKNSKPNVKLTLVENKGAAPKSIRLLSEEAKEKVIIRSRAKARKLAKSILRRWNARLDLNEIDSIVDLSLCEAAARFSPDMGASFMTFLFYHLRGNLIRTISSSANSHLVPFAFDGEGDEDLLNGFSQSYEIADALTGSEVQKPDEILIRSEALNLSVDARDKLDSLAKEVLERIFVKEEQLIDIAQDLGYSRCHISRVKRRALEHMYDHLSPELGLDPTKRPNYEEDNREGRAKAKKEIHRRKPRSQSFLARKVVNG
jgi:RNA polymerase sigma factor (sigma-70 family)